MKSKDRLSILVCVFLTVLSALGAAQSLSFSTDFDGRGTGSGFTINIQKFASGPQRPFVPRERNDSISRYLDNRYQQQRNEAEKAAREEELRRQAEEARRRSDLQTVQNLLEQLQQLQNDEPNYRQRMQYTQQVLDLEKQFARSEQEYMATLPSYRNRLSASLNHIVVPPPQHPLHYNRILIWGMFATPEEALRASKGDCKDANAEGCTDPFTGKPFDEVFAFGSHDNRDAERAGFDHFLSVVNQLTEQTKAHLGRLKGAEADEIVCHSNGCTVAEVMIATGMLKAKRLRMLGGDTSLYELQYLKDLAASKGLQEISVYVIRGDVVPVADPGWKIMDLMSQIGHPLESFRNKLNDPIYQFLGMTSRPPYNPGVKVQVHVLSHPAESDEHFVTKHLYETYARVIKGWSMSRCLSSGGATNPHCIIY